MLKILKGLFQHCPADQAFKKCLACDHGLMTTAMTFQMSFKAAGIDLRPDETAVDHLDHILTDARRAGVLTGDTLDGASIWIGCIVVEQLGGSWKRNPGGGFQIVGLGPGSSTIDIDRDVREPLCATEPLSVRAIYEAVRTQVDGGVTNGPDNPSNA